MSSMPYKALLVMIFVWPWFGIASVLAHLPIAITPTVGAGSLGTTVTVDGNTLQIMGGTRPGNGPNLFHSFGEFSIPHNNIANFLNDSGAATSNILGRVTGGNASNIFGTIQTTGFGNANLFLMNPAGIVFGPNATLNVGGSVAFTTVDYLRLANADGSNAGIFRADPTAASLLTSAAVSAFGFLGSNPTTIAVQGGRLTVQPGQSISLVGGNITVESAHLSTPGGQINIAGVGSPGEILATNLSQTSNINGQTFGTLGTVQVSQQSSIDTSGTVGGAVRIRGGSLIVDNSTISVNSSKATMSEAGPRLDPSRLGIGIEVTQDVVIDNGSVIETNVESGVDHGSGSIRITADRIEISGGPKVTNSESFPFAGIRSNIASGATAPGNGDILLHATTIRLINNGQIQTQTTGEGTAGNITLNASGNISMETAIVRSGAETPSGKAGNIALTSTQGNMSIANSFVTAQQFVTKRNNVLVNVQSGNAGDVKIDALNGDILLVAGSQISNASLGTTGKLGRIEIRTNNLALNQSSSIAGINLTTESPENILIALTGRLELTGGSFIRTGANGPANAADLNISASHILISGRDTSADRQSELTTSTVSSGKGGALRLLTDTLELMNGGKLSSESLISDTGEIPSGSAGIVSINSRNSVTIDGQGSGIFTNAEGVGPAGNVVLTATTVSLQNGGTISASTKGLASSATGGSIAVTTLDQLRLTDDASITASSTGLSDAGQIFLNAGHQLELFDGSSITTTTQSTKANGGNIDIRAIDRVRLVNDSKISTSVSGAEGSGGNIFIDPKIVIVQGSDITAKAIGGAGGNITFVTPLFLADSASTISASSERGPSGTVTIQSPTSNLSGTLGQLASKTSSPQPLLQNRCVALAGGSGRSTFIISGRNTLPVEPGGWLSSPISMEHWTGKDTEHAAGLMVQSQGSNAPRARITPKDEPTILSLRRLTPPGFLVRAFATPSTGCPS